MLFGALVASLAFEIAKGLFFYYTRARADVTQVYGEFTSVAVLLGWLYISAAIVPHWRADRLDPHEARRARGS